MTILSKLKKIATALFLLILLFISRAEAGEKGIVRIAVLKFENCIMPTKITSSGAGLYCFDSQYDYLERAFVDMLITDLAGINNIEIVERSEVEKLLNEITLGKTGVIDSNTMQEAGKALHANYLVWGQIRKKKGQFLVRFKIQDVRRGRPVILETLYQEERDLLSIEKSVFQEIEEYFTSLPEFVQGDVGTDKDADATGRRNQASKIHSDSSLAVLPFNNNSKVADLTFLSKALSDVFQSEIPRYKLFKLIERTKLDAVLQEISLGQKGLIDETTAKRIGNILGAQYMLFGSFIQLGDIIRIDARISSVEDGKIIVMSSFAGDIENLYEIQAELLERMISGIE